MREWEANGIERVAQAAQALDRLRPGWASLVEVERLDMHSIHNCLLAQVFAHRRYWNKPWTWIAPPSSGYGIGETAMKSVGFNTHGYAVFAASDWRDAWIAEIQRRVSQTAVRSE